MMKDFNREESDNPWTSRKPPADVDLDQQFRELQERLAGIFGPKNRPKPTSYLSDTRRNILYFIGGMVCGGILVGTLVLMATS